MENAKKMILIDPRTIDQMQMKSSRVQELSTLDSEMDKILRKKITDDQKAQEYNQILQKYLTYKEQVSPPKNLLSVVEDSSPTLEKKDEDFILKTIPQKFKSKAQLLFDRLNQIPDFSWNERGELIYKDETMQNSNITDLVNDVMRSRKHFQPVGWRKFSEILKSNNIPHDLVGNKKYIQEEASAFRGNRRVNQSPLSRTSTLLPRYMSPTPRDRTYHRPWFSL